MLECGWVKTSDARPACLMSWGLQVAEGEEMAQGVQPEGQNVVVAVAEGVRQPVPPSCTRLTMTIEQTCRCHLVAWNKTLEKLVAGNLWVVPCLPGCKEEGAWNSRNTWKRTPQKSR